MADRVRLYVFVVLWMLAERRYVRREWCEKGRTHSAFLSSFSLGFGRCIAQGTLHFTSDKVSSLLLLTPPHCHSLTFSLFFCLYIIYFLIAKVSFTLSSCELSGTPKAGCFACDWTYLHVSSIQVSKYVRFQACFVNFYTIFAIILAEYGDVTCLQAFSFRWLKFDFCTLRS